MKNKVSSQVLEGAAEFIKCYGQDPDDIARCVDLTPESLRVTNVMIPEIKVNELFEEASIRCNDRFFGLRFAKVKKVSTMGMIWSMMRGAKTIGKSMEILSANIEKHSQALSVYLSPEKNGFSINIEVRNPETENRKNIHKSTIQVVEHSLALLCKDLREEAGSKWNPSYIQFRHKKPNPCSPLFDFFGDNIFFDQDVNSIHLSKEDWIKLQGTISQNENNQESYSSDIDVESELPIILRVDRVIRDLMNKDGVTAALIAHELNVTVRTMQHRLTQHKTSYQQIYDRVRLDLAKQYLKNSRLSLTEISERLHFKIPAHFSRFFSQNTGHSPRDHRGGNH
ncbi:AraC family transcriptional regulator [Colwellia demingiae]|uniref:AraC family transcriptional regulator n=1 Tax=Colwellia demingiae TaxID=89401 RepID=A0A5C6QGG3_9GAMM|nr:AraC family transcriptional regulator [Colwellia demingiae]TWX68064.1 AraC family transcriptional regulator [Colwellia demingiae]